MRRRLLPALVPLLVAGCFRDADPIDVDPAPLQVHAVLQAGADSATVLISRPAADRGAYIPVPGADVRLTSGGTTVQLVERVDGAACALIGNTPIGNGTGCYSALLPQPVEAGAVYDLEIMTAGDVRITGSTQVPQPLELLTPAPGTVYPVACPPLEQTPVCRRFDGGEWSSDPLTVLELTWTPPTGAVRVDAVYRVDRIMNEGVAYRGDICQVEPGMLFQPEDAPRGSLRWPVYAIYCTGPFDVVEWDAIHLDATVAVYDPSYSRYADAVLNGDAARLDAVSAGLQGAIGVFGSANGASHELVLVRVEGE